LAPGKRRAMNFIVLAIDHGWQMKPTGPDARELESARQALLDTIAVGVERATVDLICEESDPRRLSLAQEFAYNHDPRVPWKNIMMLAQERLEAGIYDQLLNRPVHYVEEPLGSGFSRTIDHRIPEDDVREEFFSQECIKAGQDHGAKVVLVLCGDMHADALRQKLEAKGHGAVANRDLIPQRYWQ